jgi:rSAM/selenodomain-associated transferase 2
MMLFSVIIPTLNEEENIGKQIKHIKKLSKSTEIIIVDAGSTDKTKEIAKLHDTKVINSKKGRGTQQQAGAKVSSNNILVFLHADTRLPIDAFIQIEKSFKKRARLIATFRISFFPPLLLLHVVSFFSRFDTLITRFGDQCIVIRREFYEQIGGFPDWPLFEDIYLLEQARKYTHIYSIPSRVQTSSRRFLQNGVIKQLVWNAWLVILYKLGRSPSKLAEMYRRKL